MGAVTHTEPDFGGGEDALLAGPEAGEEDSVEDVLPYPGSHVWREQVADGDGVGGDGD